MEPRDKSVRKVPGVGPSLHKRLKSTGVATVGDLLDRIPTKPMEAWVTKWKVDLKLLETIHAAAKQIVEGEDPKALTARIEAKKAEEIRRRKEEEDRQKAEEQAKAELQAKMDAAERKVREEHQRKQEQEERRRKREEKNRKAKGKKPATAASSQESASDEQTPDSDSAEFGDKAVSIAADAVEQAKAETAAQEKADAEAAEKADAQRREAEAEAEAEQKKKEAEEQARLEAELEAKVALARKEAAEREAKETEKRKDREEQRRREAKAKAKQRASQAAQSAKLKSQAKSKASASGKTAKASKADKAAKTVKSAGTSKSAAADKVAKARAPAAAVASAAASAPAAASTLPGGITPSTFRKVVAVAAAILVFFLYTQKTSDAETEHFRARDLRLERDALQEQVAGAQTALNQVAELERYVGFFGAEIQLDGGAMVPCRLKLNLSQGPLLELELPAGLRDFRVLERHPNYTRAQLSKVEAIFLETLDGQPLPEPRSIVLSFDRQRIELPVEQGMLDSSEPKWVLLGSWLQTLR